jgi:N6-L-threonylcarbamoyladenine synthase
MNITILAIESSCDETAAAIIRNGKILANVIATQEIHEKYGGIVPELASRAHQQNIVPVVSEAFYRANITKSDLNAVAFTQGPGLLGSLLVGISFAKALAAGLDLPVIGINHMQAHILAHFIDDPRPDFPFLCLTVSGGHTQIVVVRNYLDMEVIGETQDDAVGEAFDKTAKILGLPYPGGPLIDKYAQKGNPYAFNFPRVDTPGFNYSFSGIKTAFLYFVKDKIVKDPDFVISNLEDICASVQFTLIEILMRKLRLAVTKTGISSVAIAGGVAANSGLRKQLQCESESKGWRVFIPAFDYCTDNAAMIAMAAHFHYKSNIFTDQDAQPEPRMKFGLAKTVTT